tara:strand:+ start:966 stop:1289 length:324 start_codon:yes stop_codon:yes gene_type:complete
MKKYKLQDMVGGWFIGNFDPSLLKTEDVEVAVKDYKIGSYEDSHFHKIAKEITVIVKGKVLMNGVEYKQGDIIVIEPGESTDFEVLEETITTVVKIPGATNDKYLLD